MAEASGAKQSSSSFILHSDSLDSPNGDDRSILTSASVSKVSFRSLARDASEDGSYISFRHRDISLAGHGDDNTPELPATSKISLAGLDATLPMAFDNERFFDDEEGFQLLLTEAADKMKQLVRVNTEWSEGNKETGPLGSLWRSFMQFRLRLTNDQVNRLRLTRGLEDYLSFQSVYESFVLGGVIRAYDLTDRTYDSYSLSLAFKNRNASRILVRQIAARWDWIWHLYTRISWGRFLSFLSDICSFLCGQKFPVTENFPYSKSNFFPTLLRLLGISWLRQFLTRVSRGDATDQCTFAQNLAAESNGYEKANLNQNGTYFGREKTNAFRFELRLPTDESIVRTFMTSPESTMINNGVEHVLRCLAKHWRNMLYQENGNFAHQRMELLSPFEVLRFHVPVVLLTLSNLRGRNAWDAQVLSPFVAKLQNLDPSKVHKRQGDVEEGAAKEILGPCKAGQKIIEKLQANIVKNVCAGIPARAEPLGQWLAAISDAFGELSTEAEAVDGFVSSVDTGIKLGYQLLKLVNWSVPTEKHMKDAVLRHLRGLRDYSPKLPCVTINSALQKLASKDGRTLKELVVQRLHHVKAAQLLLGRATTLLERELRRNELDARIRELSKGREIAANELIKNQWYWVADRGEGFIVKMFASRSSDKKRLKFIEVDTNYQTMHEAGSIRILRYIPVAEAISRAQKAFMTIELDYCKRFSINSFMEFGSALSGSSLRTRLRRLCTLSQLHCSELDKARLNVLTEMKLSVKSSRKSKLSASRMVPECKPQNVLVLGGGPTGLLTAIHCTQNVILTGGVVKLYEGRDAFDQEASSFERAQIVRLDARQVSMLRYHLGTGFEDVFVPATGETDPHLGNVLPVQGFVEVTIKRLESMLLDEVINLRSKDLLHFYTDSIIKYDITSRIFEKNGRSLKVGDVVFDGKRVLEVQELVYSSSLQPSELVVGKDYDFVRPREKTIRSYRLEMMDRDFDWYQFKAHEAGVKDFAGSFNRLPPLYPQGLGRNDPNSILVKVNGSRKQALDFDTVSEKFYRLDVSKSHVIIALGKPAGSSSHFSVTTSEPYAVCCIEGLKISMGMHNFGEKRWRRGIIDDFHSHKDQNTRIVGDFTKSVAVIPIVRKMQEKLAADLVWKKHLNDLAPDIEVSLQSMLLAEVELLGGVSFRRERLQTRFFELGNNYYLGMELPREYDAWKRQVVSQVVGNVPETALNEATAGHGTFQRSLAHQIDRLWYEATLEVMGSGDVYNPGGKSKIPRLYTIDSPCEQRLGELKEHEAFRLFRRTYSVVLHDRNLLTQVQCAEQDPFSLPTSTQVFDLASECQKVLSELDLGEEFEPLDTFEVLQRGRDSSVVRTSGGYVAVLSHRVLVGRVSDLARAPNGYSESKVALASFPVAHIVCHRTLWINRVHGRMGEDGYITAFVGDAQASPHFMRYSGLTGACINCMTFNNLVGQALRGISFEDRAQRYAFEQIWSDGQVVRRGVSNSLGDGFLRPGFPYRTLVDYLYDRAVEHLNLGDSTHPLLSRDWKEKIAAAIVPRGLETEFLFYESLIAHLEAVLREKFEREVRRSVSGDSLSSLVEASIETAVSNEMVKLTRQWKQAPSVFAPSEKPQLNEAQRRAIAETSALIKVVIDGLLSTLHFAIELRLANRRISSELFNQPKSIDTVIEDCTIEAQAAAVQMTQLIAITAATVALWLASSSVANVVSGVFGVWNIVLSVSLVASVSRYRKRNESVRCLVATEKILPILKRVFSLMTREQRDRLADKNNPFVTGLDQLIDKFVMDCHYYDIDAIKIEHFQDVCTQFKDSEQRQREIVQLMRQLTQQLIPITFQGNSYLQEDLVNIYKALNEMLVLSNQAHIHGTDGAKELYEILLEFQPKLQASIQRQRGDNKHCSAILSALCYICAPFFGRQTIAAHTWDVLQATKKLQSQSEGHGKLDVSTRDLEELYYSTRENEMCCTVVISAAIIFWFSTLFSIFRLVEVFYEESWVRTILNAATWASLGSLLGAYSAVHIFLRKLKYARGVNFALGQMTANHQIRRIRAVARIQQLLTAIRLVAVLAASVALPWSAAVSTFDSRIDLSKMIPVYIATGSFSAVLGAAICGSIAEITICYNLDPCLGRVVCEPLKNRINDVKMMFSEGTFGDIETTQKLEKEAWEYTAREFVHKYRFDTIFSVDRFSSIFHYLQTGIRAQET